MGPLGLLTRFAGHLASISVRPIPTKLAAPLIERRRQPPPPIAVLGPQPVHPRRMPASHTLAMGRQAIPTRRLTPANVRLVACLRTAQSLLPRQHPRSPQPCPPLCCPRRQTQLTRRLPPIPMPLIPRRRPTRLNLTNHQRPCPRSNCLPGAMKSNATRVKPKGDRSTNRTESDLDPEEWPKPAPIAFSPASQTSNSRAEIGR